MKFRKKPVVIEAIKFDGTNGKEIQEWSEGNVLAYVDGVFVPTLEGEMIGKKGDWIIKGIKGEFYPCKNDIFEATYEKVEQ